MSLAQNIRLSVPNIILAHNIYGVVGTLVIFDLLETVAFQGKLTLLKVNDCRI